MRKQLRENEENENPFAMSIGDLMAGLLFIFILLLTATMLKVQKQSDKEAMITTEYNQVKTQLYIDLQKEFKDSLKVWNAMPKFKVILNDFFPRYIALINQPKYKKNIEEIRIEGHTDTSGDYFTNMKLSQDRTRSVLQYCLFLLPRNEQRWAMQRITANGLSSSHIIIRNGKEDPRLSRRVEFRIRTNAEEKLEEIAKRHE